MNQTAPTVTDETHKAETLAALQKATEEKRAAGRPRLASAEGDSLLSTLLTAIAKLTDPDAAAGVIMRGLGAMRIEFKHAKEAKAMDHEFVRQSKIRFAGGTGMTVEEAVFSLSINMREEYGGEDGKIAATTLVESWLPALDAEA